MKGGAVSHHRDCNLHMNFIEKLEPNIIHDDIIVQNNVLHIIKDFPFTPAGWTNKLLEHALNSPESQTEILFFLDHLTFNESSIELLLKLADETPTQRRHLIVRSVYRIEPELMVKYADSSSKELNYK